MKRPIAVLFSALVCFGLGVAVHDLVHPKTAEAGWATAAGASCQTGTGSFVCSTSPTLATPNIGAASGTSLTISGVPASTVGLTIEGSSTASTYAMTVSGGGTAGFGGYFENGTSSGYALVGNGLGNGEGVRAVNTATGIALTVNGDTTNPARAPIYIAPANNNPAACAVGEVFVCDGSAGCGSAVAIRLCTATNTWTTVGP